MIPLLLIHPNTSTRENRAEEILSEQGMSRNHPDLLWFDTEVKMGVEQARQIKDFLSLKPYQGDKHTVIIISAENLTLDAQNTLLKTLEEPPGETLMILGISSEEQLLPTVLSRCQIIDLKTSDQSQNITNKYEKEIEKLLGISFEGRFQFIEKLKEREEFLSALTAYFRNCILGKIPHRRWDMEDLNKLNKFLKELIEAEKWNKNNVNIRAILEYLMLKMPQE